MFTPKVMAFIGYVLLALVIYKVADKYIISPEWYAQADAEANELLAMRSAELFASDARRDGATYVEVQRQARIGYNLSRSLTDPAPAAAPAPSRASVNAEYLLDDTSRTLAFCGGVFAYAANWLLLQNNEGAAKIMVFQGSRATVGFMSSHYNNGRVPDEPAAAFKVEGERAKPYMDANPSRQMETIDSCVVATNAVVTQQSTRGVKMWGKTFTELIDETAASGRATLGIR